MTEQKLTKVLLICGILSSLLYIAIDILASLLYKGYSYASQQVSELSAIGAPTRQLWILMSFIWAPLVLAFGRGILQLNYPKRFLYLAGILLMIYAVIGFTWNLAPMHRRGTVELAEDSMHIIIAGIQVLLIFLIIIFGSVADGKGFRIYSYVTLITLLVFGSWTATKASAIAEGQSTPFIGIVERVSVYSSMLWVLVFAIILLISEKRNFLVNKKLYH